MYFIFNYTWVDAFYMTTITIATVGFGEVHSLDAEGKLFTSFLIIASIFVFGYAVTTISSYFLNEDNIAKFNLRKTDKIIQKMKDHVIICGYGRNGKQAANKLKKFNMDFVVIDANAEIFEHQALNDGQKIVGDAILEKTLIQANIANAKYMIITMPSDADNVFITLTAKQLNKNITIFSRASDESSVSKLKIAGVESVIMPDKVGGDHLASLIVSPDLMEFFDNLMVDGHPNVKEIIVRNISKPGIISDLKIEEKTGCRIIGFKTTDGNLTVNPHSDNPIINGDRIIVIGTKEQIKALNAMFKQG